MSLEARLEKIAFIVREMELALLMAELASTDFAARSVARHVLIRTKDFIDHTGALLQPLRDTGFRVQDLRERRSTYMATFDEYYSMSRTKLAAHVQDLEFIDRLELWVEIEVVKLAYFVEGAREIYAQVLVPLGMPACPPWTSFPETTDGTFRALLERVRDDTRTRPSAVRIGADMLSATRPRTVSVLNFHPTHVRAAQLTTIGMWIADEETLLGRLHAHPNAERIVRARLVTDAVSFADCLVTRADGDPKHRLLGLSDLLRQSADRGADPSAIEEFRSATRFDEHLARIRIVRNRVGAHLHLDEAVDLADLLLDLDELDALELSTFERRLRRVFEVTCERTDFLGTHRTNGAILHGVVGTNGGGEHVRPFGHEEREEIEPPRRFASNAHDSQTMDHAMRLWLQGGEESASTAKSYFWDAFMSSPVVERFSLPESIDEHGARRPVEFRAAHEYVLRRLAHAPSEAEARRLLELIDECARGDPAPLALMLLRLLKTPNRLVEDAGLFDVLGALPVHGGGWARVPLVQGVNSPEPLTAAVAAGALYRRLTEDRAGAARDPSISVFDSEIAPLLGTVAPIARVLVPLAIASLFTVPTFAVSTIEQETPSVHLELRRAAKEIVGVAESDPLFAALLRMRDCIGLCVFLGEKLKGEGRHDEARLIFVAAANATVRLTTVPEVRIQDAYIWRSRASTSGK